MGGHEVIPFNARVPDSWHPDRVHRYTEEWGTSAARTACEGVTSYLPDGHLLVTEDEVTCPGCRLATAPAEPEPELEPTKSKLSPKPSLKPKKPRYNKPKQMAGSWMEVE